MKSGDIPFCVLIPSRGRADILRKTLMKMPFLNAKGVYFGIEHREVEAYQAVLLVGAPESKVVVYHNPTGSVAVAREALRKIAVGAGKWRYAVVTDDNATYTEQSLQNLVAATAEYTRFFSRACTMAGMHNTAAHFDRNLITKKMKVGGYFSYPNVAMIYQCYPMSLYKDYVYPEDAYGLDDRHFYLWAITQGIRDFRVCMDAPFNKSRYQPGGQGSLEERAEKCGHAIARLATDFPRMVGSTGTLRLPWQAILTMADGNWTGDRLVGGAMRKETAVIRKTLRIKR